MHNKSYVFKKSITISYHVKMLSIYINIGIIYKWFIIKIAESVKTSQPYKINYQTNLFK